MAKLDHARRLQADRIRVYGAEAVDVLDTPRGFVPRLRKSKSDMRAESAALVTAYQARRAGKNHNT